MFKFSIDDQKKYKKGDYIECITNEYIDESNDILVQHLALMYGKVLENVALFEVDEVEMLALAYAYLEEYHPECLEKIIKGRMKRLGGD